MKKENVNKILNEMVKDKKIDDWGMEKFSYWNNVPYVEIKSNKIFLCKTYFACHSLCIKTIYSYSSKQAIVNCINNIIENTELLNKYYISTISELEDALKGF